jgi:methyltransferase (TIGR00027 family)
MGRPSETAHRVALVRAWETQKPADARVLYDPISEHLISDEGKFLVTTRLGRTTYDYLRRYDVVVEVGDYIILRTRAIDEHLEECAQNGLAQLLILGAGYDSRAYRFPQLKAGVKIFEVDAPDTQEIKKARLIKYFGALPDHVAFVAVDFEKDDLAASLALAGYDPSLMTLVIWEGVSYYLEPEAVEKTLEFVAANTPAGSSMIFDYALSEVVHGKPKDYVIKRLKVFLSELKEPMKFGLDPDEVEGFLTERGFENVTTLTVEECKDKYLTPAHGERKPLGIYCIARARVA